MINTFFIEGEIKRMSVSEPKANDTKRGASALVLVQYGPTRESTGGSVEFVNAVMIRIPSYKFPQIRDRLAVGKRVQINGRLQGVYRTVMESGHFATELVADRVFVQNDSRGEEGADAAAA